VNTGGGGANQCTAFGFNRTSVTNGQGNYFDDLYLLDPTTGSSPFTSMLGPVRVETLFPNNTISVGPWVDATNVQYTVMSTISGTGPAAATGTIYYESWTPAQGGSLTALITRITANLTGQFQIALYDSSGVSGGPGNLIATCTSPVINPSGNATFASASDISVAFPATTLVAGTKYWIAVMVSASVTFHGWNTNNGQTASQSQAYASGFPGTASGVTLNNVNLPYMMATYTGSYALNISQAASDGDTTYNVAGTTGQEIFGHNALSLVPTTIFAAAVKSIVRKDQTSNPGLQNTLISGATTQQGTAYNPATTYVGQKDIYLNDPNTAAAWTISGVNNSQIGHNRTI
jgi:hypothetical protein